MSSPFSPPGVYIVDALLVLVDARDALFRSSSPTCVLCRFMWYSTVPASLTPIFLFYCGVYGRYYVLSFYCLCTVVCSTSPVSVR